MSKAMPSMQASELKKSEELSTDSKGSVDLTVPNHEVNDKPSIISPEENNDSVVSVSKSHSNGIEVVALRKGFYNQNRIREGEKFTVKNFEDLGEWMKCLDPDIEKEKNKFFKEKKANK